MFIGYREQMDLLSAKGTRLEAVDRKHPILICVATIAAVDPSRTDALLIHFDGWGSEFDNIIPVASVMRPGSTTGLQLALLTCTLSDTASRCRRQRIYRSPVAGVGTSHGLHTLPMSRPLQHPPSCSGAHLQS